MFQIKSLSGLIGVWDVSLAPPMTPEGNELNVADLRERAKKGELFFIDAEDEVSYRIEVMVNAEPPPDLDAAIEPFGTFRIRIPSGQVCIAGLPQDNSERLSVGTGDYILRPYTRRVFYDAAKQDEVMRKLVSESELQFERRVNNIGAFGCLLLVIGAVLLAIPFTRQYWFLVLLACAGPYLAYFVISRFPRFKAVEAIRQSYEKQIPDVVFVLQNSPAAADIPGGWVTVAK
jgi:hypothetical protein